MVRKNKFDAVDFQNATLSGGVAVGAIANLMIQPGGAFIVGTICGVLSSLGYRVIQVSGFMKLMKYFYEILSLYKNKNEIIHYPF